MKKFALGTIAAVGLGTAIGAYSADEQKNGSLTRGMMHGMKEMMAKMSNMMDMCGQMMTSSKSEPKKDQSSK